MNFDKGNAFITHVRKMLAVPLQHRFFLIGDILLTTVAVIGSFALRLELGASFNYYFPQALWMVLIALLIKPLIYRRFGLYKRLWVYAGAKEIQPIVYGVTLASMLVSVAVLLFTSFQLAVAPAYYRGFPRSVLVIDWLLSVVFIGGFRLMPRFLSDLHLSRSDESGKEGLNNGFSKPRRVIIVGAGEVGALVVREMQKTPSISLLPVCFVDDDVSKQGQQIHDVVVKGTLADLPKLIEAHRIQEVIIAIPSAPGQIIRRVTEACRQKRIRFRTMPGIYELIDGRVSVNRLRDVEITDLLRRAPAQLDETEIGRNLTGKRVLITGAGGSIGRELCRQIIHFRPESLILLGHGENSIFKIFIELQETYGVDAGSSFHLPLQPVIADIRDIDRLTSVFETYQPQVVFHVAAHKHVPLMEANAEEAVTNNVLGTRNVVESAYSFGVERLVMISSDKAIAPSSVMGATKRLAEQVVIDIANRHNLRFSVVRFGNVLGSRGSVIPHFKHQIANGGPVTVTHPEMQRYFMTIPEAVHLILQAMTLGKGGEVFVLRMGEQVRILELAEDLIRLSGLEPYKDINIVFTGMRPGEKLSEELWDTWANRELTSHPDIIRLNDQDFLQGEALEDVVADLIFLARQGHPEAIKHMLDEAIPGATIHGADQDSDLEF